MQLMNHPTVYTANHIQDHVSDNAHASKTNIQSFPSPTYSFFFPISLSCGHNCQHSCFFQDSPLLLFFCLIVIASPGYLAIGPVFIFSEFASSLNFHVVTMKFCSDVESIFFFIFSKQFQSVS